LVLAEHVADVLAKEALDALAEFLDPIHFLLAHSPRAVRCIRLARFERWNHLVDLVVPGDIGHQIFDDGKRLHRLNCNRRLDRDRVHAGHAHKPWLAVDFGRAGAALAGLAVPTAGEIASLGGLYLVYAIQHYHPFADFNRVVLEVAAAFVAAPDAEGG